MSLPLNHKMEHLHFAYVRAVVAKAGANCTRPENDYGEDLTINKVRPRPGGGFTGTGFLFQCQLKATTNLKVEDDYVVYDMEIGAYNKLVEWKGGLMILIVFKLPKDEQEWLSVTEDVLCMKDCCYYWIPLREETSTNKSSKRIRIPKNQLFDPQAVTDLLEQVRRDNRGTTE